VHRDFVEADGHHDDVQQQVDSDDHDGDADGFLETLEEYGAQRDQEDQRDENLLVVQETWYQRILCNVDRGVR
jgi:hypothetical protein